MHMTDLDARRAIHRPGAGASAACADAPHALLLHKPRCDALTASLLLHAPSAKAVLPIML